MTNDIRTLFEQINKFKLKQINKNYTEVNEDTININKDSEDIKEMLVSAEKFYDHIVEEPSAEDAEAYEEEGFTNEEIFDAINDPITFLEFKEFEESHLELSKLKDKRDELIEKINMKFRGKSNAKDREELIYNYNQIMNGIYYEYNNMYVIMEKVF